MRRLPSRLSRLPLRVRLVAGFAATMLVLLTVAGGFVYWRVQFALDRSLNESLDGAAQALAPLVTPTGSLSADSATLARVDGFQVLDATGRVLDDDARLGATPVLGPSTVRRALQAPLRHDTGELLPVAHRPLRLYATQVSDRGPGSRQVLVVAMSRDQHDEALRELLVQLTTAGLGALLLACLVGNLLARAALRPVETYRAQAAHIGAGATRVRLAVPPGRDDEITRLGHTLNDMLDALDDAMDRERRFINDASHELRTPLTLLTSRVQLMLRRPRTVEQHEAALEEITEDLTRMTRLSDQLLELGTQQGTAAADVGPADLAGAASKAVETRVALAPVGHPFSVPGALTAAATSPVAVNLGDLTLARVLDNLLDNALLHGAPPVSVVVDVIDGHARMKVTDAGPGMDPELLATASDRFARSPQARARPGSGLGLALIATAVTGAGGQLRLCFAGHHHTLGAAIPLECAHGTEMTVTVFLPRRATT
jgi:two-component system OmpR family sensor kinase